MSTELRTIRHTSEQHGPIDLHVAVEQEHETGPLILCIHGWPETWHSWRFQMDHFARLGFRVAAMDVRGYGGSSRPESIEAYRLTELCADAVAVIEELSPEAPVILFGHDWGAPIAYNTARLHPTRVRAVAGLSVPYSPQTAGDPMEFWNAVYADRFFYMKYFQTPGVAEAAFEADIAEAMRKIYYAASGDSPLELWLADRPEGTAILDVLVDPDPVPDWMAPDQLQPTIDAHGLGSMHGAFNRYRAQHLDGADIETVGNPVLQQPSCFIGGTEDIVRHFVAGVDVFAGAGASYADDRGATLIDGAGHWVQQERPTETNAALEAFVTGLS